MASRRGRTAHPARTSLDDIISRLGLFGPAIDCLNAATVDGERLTAMLKTQRTPRRFEVRPEAKFAEAFAASVAACLIGLTDIAISTVFSDGTPREAPDLLLTTSNHADVAVEVVRADETLAVSSRLFDIQGQIATLMEQKPSLRPNRQVRFTVRYEAVRTFEVGAFEQLASQLMRFYRERQWTNMWPGHHRNVFRAGSAAARAATVVEIDRPSYAAILTLERTDPMASFDVIMKAIIAKRKLDYNAVHDLWLAVEVSDPRAPFSEALAAVASSNVETLPFKRIIVSGGNEAVVLGGAIV